MSQGKRSGSAGSTPLTPLEGNRNAAGTDIVEGSAKAFDE